MWPKVIFAALYLRITNVWTSAVIRMFILGTTLLSGVAGRAIGIILPGLAISAWLTERTFIIFAWTAFFHWVARGA